MQGFLHCVWPLRMHFWAIFTQKAAITQPEIIALENWKNCNFVLKTTYKKLFLKYQNNARFPSLCLASDNASFGGRNRKKSVTP